MAEYIKQKIQGGKKSICDSCTHRNVCKAIDNQPCTECNHYQCTADVEPVKHGRWVRIGIKGRKGLPIYPCCSVCGVVSAAFRSEWEGLRGPWKFCPHCGARMDEEAKHER